MRNVKFIIISVLFISFLFLLSCNKETASSTPFQNTRYDSTHISITNASPDVSNLMLYINNQKTFLLDSPFSYGETTYSSYINYGNEIAPVTIETPYINIPSGYQQLSFGISSENISTSFSNYFQPGGSYSIFVTDTIEHGQLQCILLQDNIGKADSTKGQIRFLNLSSDVPPLDVWAFPNAGQDGFKVFSNCSYLGDDFNSVLKSQSFSYLPAGPYYFIAAVAGTTQVLLEGGLIVRKQSINSIFTKGFVSGTNERTLGIGVISYNQY